MLSQEQFFIVSFSVCSSHWFEGGRSQLEILLVGWFVPQDDHFHVTHSNLIKYLQLNILINAALK